MDQGPYSSRTRQAVSRVRGPPHALATTETASVLGDAKGAMRDRKSRRRWSLQRRGDWRYAETPPTATGTIRRKTPCVPCDVLLLGAAAPGRCAHRHRAPSLLLNLGAGTRCRLSRCRRLGLRLNGWRGLCGRFWDHIQPLARGFEAVVVDRWSAHWLAVGFNHRPGSATHVAPQRSIARAGRPAVVMGMAAHGAANR